MSVHKAPTEDTHTHTASAADLWPPPPLMLVAQGPLQELGHTRAPPEKNRDTSCVVMARDGGEKARGEESSKE